jgi:hypothetical protein
VYAVIGVMDEWFVFLWDVLDEWFVLLYYVRL